MDYTIEELLGMSLDDYIARSIKEPLKLRFEIGQQQGEYARAGDLQTAKAYAGLYDITESIGLESKLRGYWERSANFVEYHPTATMMTGVAGATLLTVLLGPIGFIAGVFGMIGGYETIYSGKGAVERGKEKYKKKIADWQEKYRQLPPVAPRCTPQPAQVAQHAPQPNQPAPGPVAN